MSDQEKSTPEVRAPRIEDLHIEGRYQLRETPVPYTIYDTTTGEDIFGLSSLSEAAVTAQLMNALIELEARRYTSSLWDALVTSIQAKCASRQIEALPGEHIADITLRYIEQLESAAKGDST